MHAISLVQLVVGALAASSAVTCYQPAIGHSTLSIRHAVLIMGLARSAWSAPTQQNTALEARKPKFPRARPPTKRDLPLYVPHSTRNNLDVRTPRGGVANANANANTANANVNTANTANTVNNANPPANRNRPGSNRRRARVYVPRDEQKSSPPYTSPLRRAEDAKVRYPHVVRHV